MTEMENDNQGAKDDQQLKKVLLEARMGAFLSGVLLAGFIWLLLDGLFELIEDYLSGFLPPYFSAGYTIAIAGGIGAWIFHLAIYGESWFVRFHPGWKGRILGVAAFFFAATGSILGFWVVFAGLPWWQAVPIVFVGFPIAAIAGISAFSKIANWMDVDFKWPG